MDDLFVHSQLKVYDNKNRARQGQNDDFQITRLYSHFATKLNHASFQMKLHRSIYPVKKIIWGIIWLRIWEKFLLNFHKNESKRRSLSNFTLVKEKKKPRDEVSQVLC